MWRSPSFPSTKPTSLQLGFCVSIGLRSSCNIGNYPIRVINQSERTLNKLIITSTDVRHQSGDSTRTGKPYSMSFQTAYIQTVQRDGSPTPFPEKIEIILEKNKEGVSLFNAPGEYTLHPSSIYVDRSGKLAIAPRLVLTKPVVKAA